MLVTIGVMQSAKNTFCIHNDDSDLRFGNGFLPFFSVREKCPYFKVARYSFSVSIPPKFEHKLRHQKQSFGKIATTVVLDKDENLL